MLPRRSVAIATTPGTRGVPDDGPVQDRVGGVLQLVVHDFLPLGRPAVGDDAENGPSGGKRKPATPRRANPVMAREGGPSTTSGEATKSRTPTFAGTTPSLRAKRSNPAVSPAAPLWIASSLAPRNDEKLRNRGRYFTRPSAFIASTTFGRWPMRAAYCWMAGHLPRSKPTCVRPAEHREQIAVGDAELFAHQILLALELLREPVEALGRASPSRPPSIRASGPD